ncbi:MAG: aminoglycoside 6-adenylyltransferase [Candidatus Limivivens sp.]|nr:aminoglycoside 6-adenylyltransferase [Candidatus Limivivens sp.]
MRTEQEMMEMLLNIARSDDRIRAAYLGGSRCNPNVPEDIFRDYDIVYVVKEIRPFLEDPKWIDAFGERLLMQLPMELDRANGLECDFDREYGYLIQLADGNRVDCMLQTLETSLADLEESRLKRVLLDKDGILPVLPEPSDESHWVRRPSGEEYAAACNEFWWLLVNVGKGLWREEILYVMDMLNLYVRPELFKMLTWRVGIQTRFSCSVGKSGKYLNHFLQEDLWQRYLATFPEGNLQRIWDSVDILCDLFSETARMTGDQLGYPYQEADEAGSRKYLERVRVLPKDAEEIF